MDDEEANTSRCPYIISFITEFIGTGILTFIGCMTCYSFVGISNYRSWDPEKKLGLTFAATEPAFGFGLVIMAIIQMFGHISPVHINPAVTLGVFILGKIHWKRVLVYVLAQYIGAVLGMAFVKLATPKHPSLCLLYLNNITEVKGFFIEFICTFVFFMTIAGSVHPRNENMEDSTPIRIGLTFAGLLFAANPYTGAGLNPARAWAPAVYYNKWDKQFFAYQLGPIAGMALAAVIYRFVLDPNQKKSVYTLVQKY